MLWFAFAHTYRFLKNIKTVPFSCKAWRYTYSISSIETGHISIQFFTVSIFKTSTVAACLLVIFFIPNFLSSMGCRNNRILSIFVLHEFSPLSFIIHNIVKLVKSQFMMEHWIDKNWKESFMVVTDFKNWLHHFGNFI